MPIEKILFYDCTYHSLQFYDLRLTYSANKNALLNLTFVSHFRRFIASNLLTLFLVSFRRKKLKGFLDKVIKIFKNFKRIYQDVKDFID